MSLFGNTIKWLHISLLQLQVYIWHGSMARTIFQLEHTLANQSNLLCVNYSFLDWISIKSITMQIHLCVLLQGSSLNIVLFTMLETFLNILEYEYWMANLVGLLMFSHFTFHKKVMFNKNHQRWLNTDSFTIVLIYINYINMSFTFPIKQTRADIH